MNHAGTKHPGMKHEVMTHKTFTVDVGGLFQVLDSELVARQLEKPPGRA